MSIDKAQFDRLSAEGYNCIPLHRSVLADLDTPLSTYLKLAGGAYAYLFESVQGGEKWGRYSIMGLASRVRLCVSANKITIYRDDAVETSFDTDDPLAAVREFKARYRVPQVAGLPRFTGGLVGYFGYETVRYIEPRLANDDKTSPVDVPDIHLLVSEEVLVFDNLSGILHVIVHVDPSADRDRAYRGGINRLSALIKNLSMPAHPPLPPAEPVVVEESDFISNIDQSQYEAGVTRAREYIRAGDIFQVVLSQRMAVPYRAHPLDLYRALRTLNPSPYMFYLNFGDYQIVGSSPEILVRLEDSQVTLRPIAGTRKRGATEAEDQRLADELLNDAKEVAEHVMLVDLGRNDVGRVAETGSVRLTEKMIIERYSHVMHIVSNVTGNIKPELDAIDVLRATFPAGTLSGAPKVRAMEIIAELEPDKRNVYAGAVGYLGWHGNMDTAIAIRTAVIHGETLYIQAGAGIVADSDPTAEWQETLSKGRAVFRAVAMASAGIAQTAGGDGVNTGEGE